MREAEIQDLGYSIGGRNISNARYADNTALIAQSPMEIQQLLDNVNIAGAQRLLKLNVKKTQHMTIGDVSAGIDIRVNYDQLKKISYIIGQRLLQRCESTDRHRYGEMKNVRTNRPVKGSVHPSGTENETG